MRFLPRTDQKCAESSTYWQLFYYRPPVKFWFTHLGEIVKMSCQNPTYIYDALDNRHGFSISGQHGIDCTILHSFFSWKVWKKKCFLNFQKLAGLRLVGEVDNHVAIYGSKVAEHFSAFQCRSCLTNCSLMTPYGDIDLGQQWLITWTNIVQSSMRDCCRFLTLKSGFLTLKWVWKVLI